MYAIAMYISIYARLHHVFVSHVPFLEQERHVLDSQARPIAYIVRRFDLDLVGTTVEDMKWDDMVVPQFHGEFLAFTKRRED
jgi:hypothetical protein